MKFAKMLLQLVCLWCIMFAAVGIIFAAGMYIAPECSMVALGLELVALIKGMDYIYEKKRNKKQL